MGYFIYLCIKIKQETTMDKIIRELGWQALDEKASIILEKVKPYNVRRPNHTKVNFKYELPLLNKVSITYKCGSDDFKAKIKGIFIVTELKQEKEEVLWLKFVTESDQDIDLKFTYLSDVNKIINSL